MDSFLENPVRLTLLDLPLAVEVEEEEAAGQQMENGDNPVSLAGGEDTEVSGRLLGRRPGDGDLNVTQGALEEQNPLGGDLEALNFLVQDEHR
jgi:hypothetical protein